MVLSVIVVVVILPVESLVVCKPKRCLQQDGRTVSLRQPYMMDHVDSSACESFSSTCKISPKHHW